MKGWCAVKPARALKFVAMLPLGFMVLVLLTFGIGEAVGGDLSGLMHLVEVAVVGVIIWLAWKHPLWGGLLLMAGAILQAVNFGRFFSEADAAAVVAPLVIMILPLAFSGLLLVIADRLEHRPQSHS
jgi:hypothetical protein